MSRYTPTEVPLDLLAGDQLALAAEHGQPVTIKVKVGGYRVMLPLTKTQIDKLKKGGRTIRMTPAHLKYLKGRGLCGRGIFGDVGKAVGPALGSAATSALSAIPGVGAVAGVVGPLLGDAITGITSAIGNEIDKGIEKRSYNEDQAAKNFNTAIQKAKLFLSKPEREQFAMYERAKKIPFAKISSFDQYYKKMSDQANQEPVTAKQQMDKRLAKKGLGAQKKRLTVRPIGGQKTTASRLAAEYIKAALAGRI